MPPSACTNLPICLRTAPVNEPFSCPNSSDSISSSGIAAQFTRTNGARARGERWWIRRATNSLPVPDSPTTRTVARDGATRAISSRSAFMSADSPSSGGSSSPPPFRRRFSSASFPRATAFCTCRSSFARFGRLVQEGVGAGLQARGGGELVAVPGEHHHRHVDVALAQVLEQTETVHARHLDVEQHGVRALAVDRVERREGVAGLAHLEARRRPGSSAPPADWRRRRRRSALVLRVPTAPRVYSSGPLRCPLTPWALRLLVCCADAAGVLARSRRERSACPGGVGPRLSARRAGPTFLPVPVAQGLLARCRPPAVVLT